MVTSMNVNYCINDMFPVYDTKESRVIKPRKFITWPESTPGDRYKWAVIDTETTGPLDGIRHASSIAETTPLIKTGNEIIMNYRGEVFYASRKVINHDPVMVGIHKALWIIIDFGNQKHHVFSINKNNFIIYKKSISINNKPVLIQDLISAGVAKKMKMNHEGHWTYLLYPDAIAAIARQ